MSFDSIKEKVGRYYTGRLHEHGASPRGADWNSEDSQVLRFAQLARVLPAGERFSIIDYGCGYGALVNFLEGAAAEFDYQGFDISSDMVERARLDHAGSGRRFTTDESDLEPAGFAVASGIFNVRLDTAVGDWTAYVMDTLERLDRLGVRARLGLDSPDDRETDPGEKNEQDGDGGALAPGERHCPGTLPART